MAWVQMDIVGKNLNSNIEILQYFVGRTMKLAIALRIVLSILITDVAYAQFSPGELSRAHEQLEGTTNCTQCHEVGKEISGGKCLNCHLEIKQQLDLKRGFHFHTSTARCVTCHKEHLGKSSHTYIFNATTFDHAQTGFGLSGGHAKIRCERCHTLKNITNEIMKKKLSESPHETYLGLSQTCNSCHKDVHKGRFKTDCFSCHTITAWKPATKFNHSTAAFKLEGKHAKVVCSDCHTSLAANTKSLVEFMTKNFADCTPCHSTPHGEKFSGKQCKSCHTTESWKRAMKTGFDHTLTAFRLKGKHESVKCEQCHRPVKKGKSSKRLRIAHERCTDCHSDKHDGEFSKTYKNDCSVCHNESGFTPSLFTLEKHDETRFKMKGAHAAVLCSSCHKDSAKKTMTFHFENIRCETCHKDPHEGSYTRENKQLQCETCHSTKGWKEITFDHSKTEFILAGKHAIVPCSKCHTAKSEKQAVLFSSLELRCESCHKDAHNKQFIVNNATDCASCHKPDGWKILIFNHETQSSFSLKGGHARVDCQACHRVEKISATSVTDEFIRYKPVSRECKSCHNK